MTYPSTLDEEKIQSYQARIAKIFNINSYIDDGFEKVCDVFNNYSDWCYQNINEELMFSPHKSWVYFIVENETIVKCGETGNPLGIAEQRNQDWRWPLQPVGSSACRLGRLRKGDGTDSYIRRSLKESINRGVGVSIWVKKCQIYYSNEKINGVITPIDTTVHKQLEQMYLNHFKENGGSLPRLNKASK